MDVFNEPSRNTAGLSLFFLNFISQNAAICPETFSSNGDGEWWRHPGDTSGDVSPMRVKSKLTVYDNWDFH